MKTVKLKYIYRISDRSDDPEFLKYMDDYKEVIQAYNDGNLYIKFCKGDRKGSIAKVSKTADSQIKEPSIVSNLSRTKQHYYKVEISHFNTTCTWTGRKNKIKICIPDSDVEFLIGDDVETVWEMFDVKAAKQKALSELTMRDIEGNALSVGDKVLFINARYGSGMELERGVVENFEASGDSTGLKFTTVVQSMSGSTSKISHADRMIYKMG